MIDRPVLLSQGMVERALKDSAFFASVPEFSQLRTTAEKVVTTRSRGGCSGCGRTRQSVSMFKDFVLLSTSLTHAGQGRLKRYFGVPGIMMNAVDPTSRQITVKVI